MRRLSRLLLCVALLATLTVPAWGVEYDIQKERELYGNLAQNDPSVQPPGIRAWACVPVATANSFVYLENKYKAVYNRNLIPEIAPLNGVIDTAEIGAVASTLALPAFMNTQAINLGTFQDMAIYGKQAYIEQKIPGVTSYAAQMSGTWTTPENPGGRAADQIPPIPAPAWVQQNMPPTWQFLYYNLFDCEDVEICINDGTWGHALTLTGFSWNDANNDGFMQQAENATINYIDPATGGPNGSPIWQNAGGFLQVPYGMHQNAIVEMAVKESPVPEPGTMVLLATGILGLLAFAWRRRARAR